MDLRQAVERGMDYRVEQILKYEELDWNEGYTLLRTALKKRRSNVASLLLSKGCKINRSSQYSDIDSCLHLATRNRDLKNVNLLLQKGALVNTVNGCDETPLHLALQNPSSNCAIIVQMLLDHGANVHCKDGIGKTPLELGCETNQSEIVTLLLDRGAHINMCTITGGAPLHKACVQNNVFLVKLFLNRGANVEATDQEGKTALFLAVKAGNPDIVKEILKFYPNKDNNGNKSICQAALSSNKPESSQIIEDLFTYGFSITADDENHETFIKSIENGHLKFVEELLKFSCDTNGFQICKLEDVPSCVMDSLTVAVKNDRLDIVKLLLKYHVYQSCVKESTDVMVSAVDGQVSEIVKLLLEHDARVNPTDQLSVTPLHLAALKGNSQICEMLLEKGADIDSLKPRFYDLSRCPPRMWHQSTARKLASDTVTPLHVAAEHDHASVVNLLIKYGADVDKKDSSGKTALSFAYKRGFEQVVQVLLNNGSDINSMNTPVACYHLNINTTLSHHITKMQAANLYVHDSIFFERYGLIRGDMWEHYEAELTLMKNEKIFSYCDTTYFEILTKSANQVAHFMRNDKIVEALKSDQWKKKFPLYAGLITCNFRKAKIRAILLKLGAIFFDTHVPFLPHIFTDQILFSLENKDLETLGKLCSP